MGRRNPEGREFDVAKPKALAVSSVWDSIEGGPMSRSAPRGLVAEEIAAKIQALIIEKDLAEASRLPSERDLAQILGTSRPTVSQAIRILVVRGLIESRRGSGAYVIRRPETSLAASVDLMLNLNVDSVSHLAELRYRLESTGVELAVERATASQIAAAESALGQIRESVGDTAAWMTADTRFHASLVEASGNPYLISIYESVHTALIDYEYRQWVERGDVPAWLQRDGLDAQIAIHEPILRAVVARDLTAAREAVQRHHEIMTQHIAEGSPPPHDG